MATGLATAKADSLLNLAYRGVAYTPPTTYYMKLHTGDPGAAGAGNPAGNTTRKAITFGSVPTGGNISNTVIVSWTEAEVTTVETYSHFSLWDAATAGTFQESGTFPVPKAVTGDAAFNIPIGDVDITYTVAS